MKRVGFIYEKIYSLENIKLAIKKSARGKKNHKNVRIVLNNIDKYAKEIQLMLKNKIYKPSSYVIKKIKDGTSKKERIIHKPKYYPDQIIHWALMLQLQSIFMRGAYYYSCGSVPKKGTGLARKALKKWLKDEEDTKWCLKMDIRKFYPTIDNSIMKQKLRNLIKDKNCLWLLDQIIDSSIGMPIGNYTSPWLSNYFLQDLDYFIKNDLKVKYYVRYVDDLVLLGANKKTLHSARRKINKKLKELKLEMKGNWQVFRVEDRTVDFIGYRFKHNCIILRKSNALRIHRRCRKILKTGKITLHNARAIISYWGWMKNSNSYYFYQKNVKPYVTIHKCIQEVRNAFKRT